MITQKMKYGLKALMVLAAERASEGRALRIEEIATRSGTPKRFLEHILLEIRNAGFIASVRGRHGGYALIKEPREVPLSELMRLIDGPSPPCPACRAAPTRNARIARTRKAAGFDRSSVRCSGPIFC